ncbi:serine protease HTR4-like [Oppia nitens]|uniref:serine protease HTR4-like n=1 Tax=Oppia nitens TaxID=1686743 RepID=UPI0023DB1747|nr:serine protease HTR4-like [Oppia nitens]
MSNRYNNNNKSKTKWITKAHMFDVNIEYLDYNYKNSVLLLVGLSYVDNDSMNSIGTAVIVDAVSKIAVTNAHVVAGYDYMFARTLFPAPTIRLREQSAIEVTKKLVARVLYVEYHLDLAIIQLEEMQDISNDLPVMLLSDRSHELGEQVAILGHGNGQLWTVCVGYITTGTPFDTISETQFKPFSCTSDESESFCLHHSNTSPGTSGAPMVDANYAIIGINFGALLALVNQPKTGTRGKSVNEFIERAVNYVHSNKREMEKFNRYKPYLPKCYQQLGIALSNNTDINTDFMVVDVIDKRMTELQINDMIVKINGQPFTDISQMIDAIENSFRKVIVLTINRNNNVMPVNVIGFNYDCIPLVF